MKKYWLVFAISIQEVFEYRFNFFVHTFKYATMVIMTAMVWLAVIRTNPSVGYTITETITYFVYAAILYSFSSFHTWYIEEDIKMGMLSKYLLKPISPFLYYFSSQSAHAVIETIIKMGVFLPILYTLGFLPSFQIINALLFLVYLPFVFFFSFTIFSLISSMSFWLTDVYAIRWSLTVIFRLLSGMMVPLSFFPENFQRILYFLPFQHLVFTPIRLMQNALTLGQGIDSLKILILWTVFLSAIRIWIWNRGAHSYESAGI